MLYFSCSHMKYHYINSLEAEVVHKLNSHYFQTATGVGPIQAIKDCL